MNLIILGKKSSAFLNFKYSIFNLHLQSHDLAILMRQMEHWAHRLFPKMPFDEVIERVEKLGSKKEVQTCIKKIRLDMPVLAEDFVGSDREDDDGVRRGYDEPEISAQVYNYIILIYD